MSFIVDLILLAIIIITAFISAKYGFVRTVIEIAGFILVMLIVNSSSVIIAEKIYDGVISKKIVEASDSISDDTIDSSQKFFDSLPQFVTKANGVFGVDEDRIKKSFNDNIKDGVKNATEKVNSSVIKPVVLKPLSLIISIVLFLILNSIVHIIARFSNKLIKKSILGGINSRLGFIIGIPKGIIVAMFLIFLLLAAVNIFDDGIWVFNRASVENSYFVRILSKIMPAKGIFKFILNV